MLPKQRTKAELKQQVGKLTVHLWKAEHQLDGDVETERDGAQQRTDEVECQLLELKQEIMELKRPLEELRVEKDHMMTEKADACGWSIGRGVQFVASEYASDEVDQLEWKLEMSQRDMQLQAARAKEQAQTDHQKELDACDELIALLEEKVQKLRGS